jgi:hypothetical protein
MIDQALLDAGIQSADIETRLEGQGGKTLMITKRELLYFENGQLQRGRLREIVNVKTAKTGELTVKSPNESLIEGTIKGFDLAELKFFFENVKTAIARAKASVTATDLPAPAAPAPLMPAPAPSLPEPSPPAAAWQAPDPNAWDNPSPPTSSWDSSAPSTRENPSANAWASPPSSNAWMPEKQTFEVAPDVAFPNRNDLPPSNKDSWADLEAELNPAKSGSVPPLLNASAMIPPPSPSAPSKPPVDPFADLAKNASKSTSSDDWGSPSATINLKPDTGATAIMVPSSGTGEWGGEVMDATTALDSKTPQKGKPNVRIGDNSASIEGIARMLRILALTFFVVSAAVPAVLLLEAGNGEVALLTIVLMLVALFGSLLLSLMAWGLSELLMAWAKASADLRSIRKATLGH